MRLRSQVLAVAVLGVLFGGFYTRPDTVGWGYLGYSAELSDFGQAGRVEVGGDPPWASCYWVTSPRRLYFGLMRPRGWAFRGTLER